LLILVHFISLRPDCQRRIAVETKDFRDFASLDEIKEAHFTRAVIMESFRLCPSAFALARIAESDIDLSGYHIKAGVII
jgi:cytochrome P450